MDAGLGARAISIDAHHHRADTAVAVEPDRLQSKTEIASCDLAMCFDLCGDARDRRGWDDENPAPRAEHRHAEGLTGRIESNAAFGVPPERQVRARSARRSLRRASTARRRLTSRPRQE